MSTDTAAPVVIAPDKFKGSADAMRVASRLAVGIRRTAPEVPVTLLPVADGGEGTVDAAVAAGFERRSVAVTGPLDGTAVDAHFALRDELAVIEMAQAAGLQLLPAGRPAPLEAGTRGVGQLVTAALDAGARTIVLGAGGSASTDGGAGMLAALGARLLDEAGRALPGGGGALARLARVDTTSLDARLARTGFVLAADVDNPLLGPQGAAAAYGPQKGADPQQVALLEASLGHYTEVLAACLGPAARQVAGLPGSGAAGGFGFAVMAVLQGVRVPGIDVLLDLLGLAKQVAGARLVITGEGSLDAQSLRGKAPLGVAQLARRHAVPTVAVCGRLALTAQQAREAGFRATYALTSLEPDPRRCMSEVDALLEATGEQIAREQLRTG
ncbi:glycerate kinase [Kitasatospora sp. NPDC058965]|uniref:glycerate kinase n=1 Tax=Kitasatospora sp. NPDC058965 TaxID=3346682 RepID=UPI00369EEBCD